MALQNLEKSCKESLLDLQWTCVFADMVRGSSLYVLYGPFTPSLRRVQRNDGMSSPGTLPILAAGLVGRFAIRILEALFGLGIIGSALVVVITFVEDLKEVFSADEPRHVEERSVTAEHIHA